MDVHVKKTWSAKNITEYTLCHQGDEELYIAGSIKNVDWIGRKEEYLGTGGQVVLLESSKHDRSVVDDTFMEHLFRATPRIVLETVSLQKIILDFLKDTPSRPSWSSHAASSKLNVGFVLGIVSSVIIEQILGSKHGGLGGQGLPGRCTSRQEGDNEHQNVP